MAISAIKSEDNKYVVCGSQKQGQNQRYKRRPEGGEGVKFKMIHNNINVSNLKDSIEFYEKALGLKEVDRINGNGFTIVYLGDGMGVHLLELTELASHP